MITRLSVCLTVVLAACDPADNSTPHPRDRLDFPVSVTADPSGERVWVVSGNFDLKFRSAAVLAIDTTTNAFIEELAFEVGGFPGELELLVDPATETAKAAYITSREEDSLFFATLDDAGVPTCPGGERVDDEILECPKSGALEDTRVDTEEGELEIDIGTDPYSATIVPKRGTGTNHDTDLLLTGAMGNGRLAMFELAEDGTPSLVGGVDIVRGLFGLSTNPKTGRVYASSKVANFVTVLNVAPRFDEDQPGQDLLDPVNPFIEVAGTVQINEPPRVTDRARSTAVSSDGTRLYVAYRGPDSLDVFDIADTSTGAVRSRLIHKIALDDDPNDVLVVPQPDGSDLVYVSCFRADRVEVVDPVAGEIIGGIHVGDGPSGMAFVDNGTVRRLYVALFHAHAVGVVELDPTSPFFHTEVGEIR